MRTRIAAIGILVSMVVGGYAATEDWNRKESRSISKQVLEDKIRGGWAGQMIGVSFGAPTEFESNRKIIEGNLPWTPDRGF